jgi:hypothetical protein
MVLSVSGPSLYISCAYFHLDRPLKPAMHPVAQLQAVTNARTIAEVVHRMRDQMLPLFADSGSDRSTTLQSTKSNVG